MSTAMIKLEIDGKTIEVAPGTMIIQAAELLDIYIPRYCYHKHLSIAANCRMCLVEVENVGKPLPACATPVASDMKVMTQSPKALEAQRAVMEFLLINHPLDCPVCDQGGMCELQDSAMGYGSSHSYFEEGKLSTRSENIGPLIETWMTRCIKCTRCVRFGDEIAGVRELGVVNRGQHAEISTYVKKFVDSELSGNIIDICPVGALTDKPSRYQARNWSLTEFPGVALHDCVGSHVYWHMRSFQTHAGREVMATVPRENSQINETWISDRDRFSLCGLSHADRVSQPKMKTASGWREVSWDRALPEIADKIKGIVQHQGVEEIAFLTSTNVSTEAMYLMQKCARSMGCHNVDHRLKQQDFFNEEQYSPAFTATDLSALENKQQIVLIGSNVRHEQPMISHRIRKASLAQAQVSSINPQDFGFNFDLSFSEITADMVSCVMQLAKAMGVEHNILTSIIVGDSILALAKQLKATSDGMFLLGAYALEHPQSMTLRWLVEEIGKNTGYTVAFLSHGANTPGAWKAGMVPHRDARGALLSKPGKTVQQLLGDEPVRAYILLNLDPEFDVAQSASALSALKQAGLVVCFSVFESEVMREYANFILPIAPYTEETGTYYNVSGLEQEVRASSIPYGDAKPAWKIWRVLGHFLELKEFLYASHRDVLAEIHSLDLMTAKQDITIPLEKGDDLSQSIQRYAYTPIYNSDPILRRSQPLAETSLSVEGHVAMNSECARQRGFEHGQTITVSQADHAISLPVIIDDTLPSGLVAIPQATQLTAGWGVGHSVVELGGDV
jgi:NADH-quinone oxidoreductase subunit G